MSNSFNKGSKVRVLYGKYYGLKAWKNKDKDDTADRAYIIALLSDGSLYKTGVPKHMVESGSVDDKPPNLVKRAFNFFPELERDAAHMGNKLAKCKIDPNDVELQRHLKNRFKRAADRHKGKGRKAEYYDLSYDKQAGMILDFPKSKNQRTDG